MNGEVNRSCMSWRVVLMGGRSAMVPIGVEAIRSEHEDVNVEGNECTKCPGKKNWIVRHPSPSSANAAVMAAAPSWRRVQEQNDIDFVQSEDILYYT